MRTDRSPFCYLPLILVTRFLAWYNFFGDFKKFFHASRELVSYDGIKIITIELWWHEYIYKKFQIQIWEYAEHLNIIQKSPIFWKILNRHMIIKAQFCICIPDHKCEGSSKSSLSPLIHGFNSNNIDWKFKH